MHAPDAHEQTSRAEFDFGPGLRREQRIDDAEGEAIRERWEIGRWMLGHVPEGKKKLPDGFLAGYAKASGKSRTELQYRKQLAERYPDADALSNALDNHPSWHEVVNELLSEKSTRYAENAAGAHEGVETSEADAEGDDWKLLLGRFQDRLADIPAGSVTAIVTDPPYGEEHLPEWEALGHMAPELLVPGGVLLARCGHLLLPRYIDALGAGGLQFGWLYAEPLPGSNVRFQGRKIAVSWQPWLAFSNGPWPSGRIDWHPDTLTESPRTKARFVWEQKWDVAAELTQTFASPGALVLDPFAGSGSYGEAALAVGCRWVGVEADPAGHAAAAGRLAG
jgi:16S rRNA G966 N2-methylase RsmD